MFHKTQYIQITKRYVYNFTLNIADKVISYFPPNLNYINTVFSLINKVKLELHLQSNARQTYIVWQPKIVESCDATMTSC